MANDVAKFMELTQVGGPPIHPINQSVAANVDIPPLSCMINLIDNYMNCNQKFPEDKLTAAYNAYIKTLNINPPNQEAFINSIRSKILSANEFISIYIFALLGFIVLVLIVTIFVASGKSLGPAMYLALTVLMIIYSANITYRLYWRSKNIESFDDLVTNAQKDDKAYKDSIAYMPQALMAVACAITCDQQSNPKDCWSCTQIESLKELSNTVPKKQK